MIFEDFSSRLSALSLFQGVVTLTPPRLASLAQPWLGPCTHLHPGLLLLSTGRGLGWAVFKGVNLGYSCCWRGTSVPTEGFCFALPEIIAQLARSESLGGHTSLQEPAGGDSTPRFPHCAPGTGHLTALRHFKILKNHSSSTCWVLCCCHTVQIQMHRDPPWWSKVKRTQYLYLLEYITIRVRFCLTKAKPVSVQPIKGAIS